MVSSGPYRYVRHPIYAIRMVIDACAWVLGAQRGDVLILAGLDIVLMQVESRGGRNGIWKRRTRGGFMVPLQEKCGKIRATAAGRVECWT